MSNVRPDPNISRASNSEKYADYFFMLGLVELGVCAFLLAFEII